MQRSLIDMRNTSGSTLKLYNASLIGKLVDMIWYIDETNARPNEHVAPYGWTPLHAAASRGHTKAVELLLNKYKVSINSLSNDGNTPLHVAAHNGHREVVSLLIRYGASLTIENNDTLTPYTCIEDDAISKKLADLLNLPEFTRPDGQTALHVAASEGHTEIVSFLLYHGEKIDTQDDNGNTALHLAVLNNHSKTVAELVKRGALDIKNKDNQSPFELIGESKIRGQMGKLFNAKPFFIIAEKQLFTKSMSFWKQKEQRVDTSTSASNQTKHYEKPQHFTKALNFWKEREAQAQNLSATDKDKSLANHQNAIPYSERLINAEIAMDSGNIKKEPHIDCMDRFFGCNRDYTGPLKVIPKDHLLNAPVTAKGNIVVLCEDTKKQSLSSSPHNMLDENSYEDEKNSNFPKYRK